MAYSKDIRRLVVAYVRKGGSKTEAVRRFGVSRGRVYEWLKLGDSLSTGKKPGPKKNRKIDAPALTRLIEQKPDSLQKEIAQHFGVHESSISHAFKRMGISRKKNVGIY